MAKKSRPLRIVGDVAFVPLTKGYEAIIDLCDADSVGMFNWTAHVNSHTVYAKRGVIVNGTHKTVYMHRYILSPSEDEQVDHKDCNGLNNSRSNLRPATGAQNSQNQRIRSVNKVGLKGVSVETDTGKFLAQIRINGRKIRLGSFDSMEEAHQAYRKASEANHGIWGRVE